MLNQQRRIARSPVFVQREYPGAPLPLGFVHRLVRFGQQLRRSSSFEYRLAPIVMVNVSLSPSGNCTGLSPRSLVMRCSTSSAGRMASVVQGEDELVTAPARQPVALPDVAPDYVRDVPYADVPGQVAVCVVYGFEVVHVNHPDGQRTLWRLTLAASSAQALLYLSAVEEPCQWVGAREPFQKADA